MLPKLRSPQSTSHSFQTCVKLITMTKITSGHYLHNKSFSTIVSCGTYFGNIEIAYHWKYKWDTVLRHKSILFQWHTRLYITDKKENIMNDWFAKTYKLSKTQESVPWRTSIYHFYVMVKHNQSFITLRDTATNKNILLYIQWKVFYPEESFYLQNILQNFLIFLLWCHPVI